ncbi:MAG: YfhO family protein, partial [Flavobacteriales bacterium]
LGNAWFVKEYELVLNADSELLTLNDFDPSKTAIVDSKFSEMLDDFIIQPDTAAHIRLTDYKPNALAYESQAQSEQLAVFSEIYYPDGWNAYLDGEPAQYFRANYVLRAMRVPAGKHKIEFRFEPMEYAVGEAVSLISSILLLLVLAGVAYGKLKQRAEDGS